MDFWTPGGEKKRGRTRRKNNVKSKCEKLKNDKRNSKTVIER